MPLAPGDRLGPYEVHSALGAGGMGEVYRARDTRLNRDVAIKVLPDAFVHDADRLARFKREAHVLASLNHPHIAAIYGLEESASGSALVLELVEGPTLADRIARGPIPIDEALPIARQIADALEAAHEHGVIHRDLKPANIKLTPDGNVKVLDFGLAKAMESSAVGRDFSRADASLSPTITSPAMATHAGIILGTAAYMSPEQARGKSVDKRSDIWAFGCVLYEMLTGKSAFIGDDVSLTLSKILQREPEWTELPARTPPRIVEVLRRCLKKDARERLRDIGDARIDLDAVLTAPAGVEHAPRRVVPLRTAAACVGAALVAGAAATLVTWRAGADVAGTPRVARFAIIPESEETRSAFQDVLISADGSRIVYVVQAAGSTELRLRTLEDVQSVAIQGTRGAAQPFFSPTGDQIGFDSVGDLQLKRIPIGGGAASLICTFGGQPAGASWGSDGNIIFAQVGGNPGLFRVPETGGTAQLLIKPDPSKNEREFRYPHILPGGASVLYTVIPAKGGHDAAHIAVHSLDTGERKVLIEAGADATYSPTGHIVYGRSGALFAVPFDVARLELAGSPVVIQDSVVTSGTGDAAYALSGDGTLVYLPGRSDPPRRLVWVSRNGREVRPLTDTSLSYARYPRLSPDGRRLAITIGPSFAGDVWVYDLASERQPVKLTYDAHQTFPIWSPDGRSVVYQSDALGPRNMFLVSGDASTSSEQRLLDSDKWQTPLDWSPDGNVLLYHQTDTDTRGDLWILPLKDARRPVVWLQTRFNETDGRFSPNGRWIAYVSDQTGAGEVWVRGFRDSTAPIRISSDGGREPVWSRDGRELYYQSGARLMAIRVVEADVDFRFDAPRVLVEGGFITSSAATPRTYDAAPDGRLVMIQPMTAETARPQFVLVQNWIHAISGTK